MSKQLCWVLLGLGLPFGPAMAGLTPDRDCTRIVSAVERLACFDQAAGTPVTVPPVRPRSLTVS
ncbi:hypothetical protein WGM54_28425, partial [Paenibacillus polymyxa]|uniref:hypothetical protein n=1 Tax=Paenibacillus polymyxa TaxID=1406 RepID=UPI00307F06D1